MWGKSECAIHVAREECWYHTEAPGGAEAEEEVKESVYARVVRLSLSTHNVRHTCHVQPGLTELREEGSETNQGLVMGW